MTGPVQDNPRALTGGEGATPTKDAEQAGAEQAGGEQAGGDLHAHDDEATAPFYFEVTHDSKGTVIEVDSFASLDS